MKRLFLALLFLAPFAARADEAAKPVEPDCVVLLHGIGMQGFVMQRIATALVYLNDGYAGGETRFVATGTTVSGRRGGGLVFRNVDSEGCPDKQAAHCGMPVTKGVKLLASRWIREREFVAR